MKLDAATIARYRQELQPRQWERLQSVLDSLDRNPVSEEIAERRSAVRSRFVFPVQIVWADGHQGGELWVMTHNISRGGIGLIARRQFHIDERVTIRLPMPDHSTRQIAGRVAFCRYISDMYHDIGVQFTSAAE